MTVNAGEVWTKQISGTVTDLNGVHFINGLVGWAVGDKGLILKTTNAGATWIKEESPVTGTLHSIDFADAAIGWIVGMQSPILKSAEGSSVKFTTHLSHPNQFLNINYAGNTIKMNVLKSGFLRMHLVEPNGKRLKGINQWMKSGRYKIRFSQDRPTTCSFLIADFHGKRYSKKILNLR